jgi:hypothetical protein
LLDRQRLEVANLPAYVERVEIYRDFNQRFFQLPAAALAAMLQGDLERVGAVRVENGWLQPA